MEVDSDDLPGEKYNGISQLSDLILKEPVQSEPNAYIKKTVLQSSIIRLIVPQFSVCVTKPFAGLPSSYTSEERDQTWVPPEQDSYFDDDMSEDEAMFDLGNHTLLTNTSQDNLLEDKEEVYVDIEVVVKYTSLLVAGVEYPLMASVTAAEIVPCQKQHKGEENSLLLALSSGFQLLIRIWKVPRLFADPQDALKYGSIPENTTSHIFKPYVVQWWRRSCDEISGVAGSAFSTHPGGLAVVATFPEPVMRIHTVKNTKYGIQLSPHLNVPVQGAILHTCFAHSVGALGSDNHVVLLVVTLTNSRRLTLTLYSWHASEPLMGNIQKTTLPLKETFQFPVMVVSLAENSSFLFVCPDEFVIVTANNIWSADYSFSKFAYDGSFPTSFYTAPKDVPQENEVLSPATDEVFLASANGVIYSVIVTDNRGLMYRPILRIADPISTFTLNHSCENNGFVLSFASDSAGAKVLHFTSLISPDSADFTTKIQNDSYTEATLLKDYRNWAPIVDVVIVDAPHLRNGIPESAQEMWALTGLGKRTKLTHLRSGYAAHRELRIFDGVRKADKVYLLSKEGAQYLICSMPFETSVLQYIPGIEEPESETMTLDVSDPIVTIYNASIVSDVPTLCCAFLPGSDILYQFTRRTITASNMVHSRTMFIADKEILFAEMIGDISALAMEKEGCVTIEVVRLAEPQDLESPDASMLENSNFRVLCSIPGTPKVSMMKSFVVGESLLIVCGTFSGLLHMFKVDCVSGQYTSLSRIDLNQYSSKSIPKEPFIIAHDAALCQLRNKLYVGSKSGHYIELDIFNLLMPVVSQIFKLGTAPVSILLSKNDPHFLFVIMRNVWIFNFYVSSKPNRVSFVERIDKAVQSMTELPTQEYQHLRFAFLREDGLVIGSVFCHEMPLLKQLSIHEPAKKIVHLDTANVFVILCNSKLQHSRLTFADRKNFRLLLSMEIDAKSASKRKDPIFGPREIPICAMIWRISRNKRVSKKLIVGTSIAEKTGNLKILDISKVMIEGSKTPLVKVVELMSIATNEPVSSIQQLGSRIFYSVGRYVYFTSYSLEKKKFTPVVLLEKLHSEIANLGVAGDDTLLVNTYRHSVLGFRYLGYGKASDSSEEYHGTGDELGLTFKDPVSRSFTNVTGVGGKYVGGDKLFSALRIFDPKVPSPNHCLTFKLSMIPRVFATDFRIFWNKSDEAMKQISCVGVNGQIVLIKPVYDGGEEICTLKENLAKAHSLSKDKTLESMLDFLLRPFSKKVTGKGFYTIDKPFFGFDENKAIDYDVDELSRSSQCNFFI